MYSMFNEMKCPFLDLHELMTANLPDFDELPFFQNFKGCAWGIWGPRDQLGTVNILTEDLVKQAATEEVVCEFEIDTVTFLDSPVR